MQSRNCASPFFLPPARRGSTNFKTKVQFLFSSFVVFLSFPWCLFFLLSSSSLSSFANPPNTASASTSTPVLSHTDTRAITGSTAQSSPPPKPTGSSGSVWSRAGPNAPDISRSVWCARTKSLSRTPDQAGHVWARNCELQIRMGARGPEHMRAGTNAGKNVRMPARYLVAALYLWDLQITYGTCWTYRTCKLDLAYL